MISIIIPTLNEEKYLPLLLKSIKKQDFSDYEVIVADAGSKDATRRIAREFGAKVVKGGIPAAGRNAGAKAAKGEFLFFLDADVVIPRHFLKNAYREMQERYLDLATCELKPLSSLLIDKVLHELFNLGIKLSQLSDSHAPGPCTMVTRRLFGRIDGFDTTIKVGEDLNFARRAGKFRPIRVLRSTYVEISVRRLDKEGRAELVRKYIQVELHRLFKGEVRHNLIEYEYANYESSSPLVRKKLSTILQRAKSLNKEFNKASVIKPDSAYTKKAKDNAQKISGQAKEMALSLKNLLTGKPKK
ncbi:TPA: glycosyltransferase, partial [Candidatus Woesearchaeota archaeon]|nr:glycosyltransferase [Candidatus Woesearchaeota archaeon]